MRKKIFSRLLITVYSILFTGLVAIRVYEHWEMTDDLRFLQKQISNLQTRKTLLSKTGINAGQVEQDVLKYKMTGNSLKKTALKKNIENKEKENDNHIDRFTGMVTDTREQRLLNRMILLREQHISNRKRLLNTPGQSDSLADKEALSFEAYQKAAYNLTIYADSLDNAVVTRTEKQIAGIENTSTYINTAILFIVLLWGGTLVITIRSIKDASNKLGDSENKYRTLTEQTHEIINRCDSEGNIVFANEAFKKILKYNEDELYRLKINDLYAEESLHLYKPNPEKFEFGEIIKDTQRIYKTSCGKKIYVEGNILLDYEGNEFVGATAFFKDITSRIKAQETIKAMEERFRNIFNLGPAPMWVIDPDSLQFIQVNESAIRHYGYSEKEFLEMTIVDIHPPESEKIEILKAKIAELIKRNTQIKVEVKHKKRGGELIDVEIYSIPVKLDEKLLLLTICVDITARIQYENKLTRAILKTQEEERYAIGSELHDNVCQILAAAHMSLTLVKKRSLDTDEIHWYDQTAEHITAASREIRSLSHRLAPIFFDKSTLHDAFSRLLQTFNTEDKYKVSVHFDKTIKDYHFSPELQLNLYRILQEQLNNIFKYAQASSIDIEVLRHKGYLKMRVADNGVGFDVNEITGGIGMANMKRRAELFSGSFMINSSLGHGVEIVVQVPIDKEFETKGY